MPTATLTVPLPELAQARLTIYCFLLAALGKPTAEQHAWFARPDFVRMFAELSEPFGIHLPDNPDTDGWEEHQARYIACFEVGLPGPPVPLLASHYNHREPVTAVIHEHILFCRRFGASLAADNREPADHLLTELAFLVWLDELMLRDGAGVPSLLQARRDFLKRQAAGWPKQAAAEAVEKGLPAVYRALLERLAAAVAQDLELTEAPLAEREGEKP